MQTSPGLVPCSDAAGIVEEVGAESGWKVGDRVILHPNTWLTGRDERGFDIEKCFGGGTEAGTLTEYMVVGDERLNEVPEHLSLEEASTLPTAGGTGKLRLTSQRTESVNGGSDSLSWAFLCAAAAYWGG